MLTIYNSAAFRIRLIEPGAVHAEKPAREGDRSDRERPVCLRLKPEFLVRPNGVLTVYNSAAIRIRLVEPGTIHAEKHAWEAD